MKKSEQKIIDQIKETLKAEYQPQRLILFGSRVGSGAKKNSDYDFVMVISNSEKSSIDQMAKARSLLFKKHGVSVDIFIYSEREFEDWKNEFNSIPEIALNTGNEIDL